MMKIIESNFFSWIMFLDKKTGDGKKRRFTLDCKPPSVQLNEFLYHENRFATIKNNYPQKAEEFLTLANEGVNRKWETLEVLKAL